MFYVPESLSDTQAADENLYGVQNTKFGVNWKLVSQCQYHVIISRESLGYVWAWTQDLCISDEMMNMWKTPYKERRMGLVDTGKKCLLAIGSPCGAATKRWMPQLLY